MKDLSNILEKVYNLLGNSYLVSNFETEPFEFKVNVRKGIFFYNESYDYIIEIYSTPAMPKRFVYRNRPENSKLDGAHISVIRTEFKKMVDYVDTSFGGFGRTLGIKFMNVED